MLIMSEMVEGDTPESSGTENHVKKYEISPNLEEKLRDVPEALSYIKHLEKQLRKHKKKLKKIRAKLKVVKRHDVSTQTETKTITEEITEAAELATQNAGFVYDETCGLYYDSNTGYYYNAEYGLYYEPSTGTYMTYKPETNTYEFHSRVAVPREIQIKRKKKCKDESKASKCVKLDNDTSRPETEEGECSGSTTDDDTNSDTSDLSKQWPPCMRIIVEQSQVPKIKIGSLHIVTFEGGTLGREGTHSIVLPDINISKSHLKFTYDSEKGTYHVTDLGSRNGTILNGKRISTSKQESSALEVPHGSRIQVGSVVLLCHVHDGYKTCGHCEPGLVQSTEKKIEVKSKATKSEQHKNELKKLRKKFGVSLYEESGSKLASGYTDRAQKRRETVGSQNPHEKTEIASLDESIPAQNKGFKMLEKMGWKEGQSLGKDSQGLLEPVRLVSNPGTSGMGSGDAVVADQYDKNKQIIWKKTQERFKKLPTTSVFEESD